MADRKKKELTSAWELDKKYGTRVTQAFAHHEPFVLLGAKIEEETIDTVFGDARVASLLVCKLRDGKPVGDPFKVGTVASAIVDKIEAAVDGDYPAVVMLLEVPSKQNPNKPALVLQYVGQLGGATNEALSEFGVDAATVGRQLDAARGVGDSMGGL